MRKSLFAVIAAGLSLTLTACGGATSSTSSGGGSDSAPAASGKLTIWVDNTRVDGFKQISEAFKASSGVDLDVVQKPPTDIKTDFIAQAPTGQGPDLLVGAHDWVGDLTKNGIISPVELGDKAAGFNEAAIRAFTLNGQVYGVPYAVENIALVRNNKLAKDTPATFDELIAQGKGVPGAQFPAVIEQGDQGDAYHLYPVQTSFGAPVLKTDSSGAYTSELGMAGAEGEAFAAYLKKLADAKVVSPSINADKAKQAFLDGKTPYILTGPWGTTDFKKKGMDISVLPVPSAGGKPSAPFIGVQGVYLSSKSNNALLAGQFFEFMSGKQAQDKLFETGGRMPALTESARAVSDPVLKGFAEAASTAQPMPALAEMSAVWKFWGSAEISIINGKAGPVSAWQGMVKNIKAATKKS